VDPLDPFKREREILFGEDGVPSTYKRTTWVTDWSRVISGNEQPKRGHRDMATKSLFTVTLPSTLTVVVIANDEKDAVSVAAKKADSVLGASFGVLSVVGDAKVTPVSVGKKSKSKAPVEDEDKEEDGDEEEEEEEEEDSDEEEEEEEEEEDGDEEEEEEEEEEERPAKKKSKDKSDDKKKSSDKGDGKKKIKIKLKG
jgi:Mg-chelatase subunit ChlI